MRRLWRGRHGAFARARSRQGMDTGRRSQDMHVADRLVNLLSPLSLLTHALTKVAHVSNDILIEGLRTATCNLIFFLRFSPK